MTARDGIIIWRILCIIESRWVVCWYVNDNMPSWRRLIPPLSPPFRTAFPRSYNTVWYGISRLGWFVHWTDCFVLLKSGERFRFERPFTSWHDVLSSYETVLFLDFRFYHNVTSICSPRKSDCFHRNMTPFVDVNKS